MKKIESGVQIVSNSLSEEQVVSMSSMSDKETNIALVYARLLKKSVDKSLSGLLERNKLMQPRQFASFKNGI